MEEAIESVAQFGDMTVTYSDTLLPQDRLGKFCPGRSFTVQFDSKPGDLPLLDIDSTNLVGSGLVARIVEVQQPPITHTAILS